MSNVTVLERQSNKLMLSWSPGHDGFSPLTICHIRVSLMSAQTAMLLKGKIILYKYIDQEFFCLWRLAGSALIYQETLSRSFLC